jgi:quercetin dioxygenase-like cupin family protein
MTTRSISTIVLLAMLASAPALGDPTPTATGEAAQMIALDPGNLEFTKIPNMPSCATGATLRGDPRTGPSMVLLKLESGCRVPWHWHTANEDIVVISGQGKIEMRDGPSLEFVPGAFASLPNQHTHQASCHRSCLLLASSDAAFDIHYVNTAGEEISTEKALGRPTPNKGMKE